MKKMPGISCGLLKISLLGLFTFLAPLDQAKSQSLGFRGQAIGWTTLNPAEPFQAQAGLLGWIIDAVGFIVGRQPYDDVGLCYAIRIYFSLKH